MMDSNPTRSFVRSSHFLPLILQICPPTREYPRVFTGATDTGVPCHFPEALKHIEAKCHGQVGWFVGLFPDSYLLSCAGTYRVTRHIDFVVINLGSSTGLWAANAASYCPSRPGEHPKLIAT